MPTEGPDRYALSSPGDAVAAADEIVQRVSAGHGAALLDALVSRCGAMRADLWRYDGLEPQHVASGTSQSGTAPRVPVDAVQRVMELAASHPLARGNMLVAGLGDEPDVSVRQLTVLGLGSDPALFVAVLHGRLTAEQLALTELLVSRVAAALDRDARRDSEARAHNQAAAEAAESQRRSAQTASTGQAESRSAARSLTPSLVPGLSDAEISYIPPKLAKQLAAPGADHEVFDRLATGLFDHVDVTRAAVYDRSCHRMAQHGDPSPHPSRERGMLLDVRDGLYPHSRPLPREGLDALVLPLRGSGGNLGWAWLEWDGLTGPPDEGLATSIVDYAASVLDSLDSYHARERAFEQTVGALQGALDAADQYTGDHARHVAEWAVEVGCRLGLDGPELRDVEIGALLHDIGKIAMPREILNKPGALTDAEFEVMKAHTVVGERIIAPIADLDRVRAVVRHEHERWDGRGYPDGLSGEDIPIGSRIILVADAYHAITSDRPYRQGQSGEKARAILMENAGSQFDPAVVSVFCEVLDDEEVSERIERLATMAVDTGDPALRATFAAWEDEVAAGAHNAAVTTQEERHEVPRDEDDSDEAATAA